MQTKHSETLDKTGRQFPPLEGAVCAQYRRCGKAACHCASGEKHGPYFYRCWRAGGKLHQEYVKPADVEAVRAACAQRQANEKGLRRAVQQSNAQWRRLRAALREYGM